MGDDSGGTRTIKLRYAGRCVDCRTGLPARTEASWDESSRTITCLACAKSATVLEPVDGDAVVPAVDHLDETGEPEEIRPPVYPSAAGRSAQAEYERRHQKRKQRLEAKWGRLAGIAKFLSDDPQSTKAWARGAEGERRLAAHLARALGDRAVFLHDRRYGRANIDHLVIASSGVWVIDAKNYQGRVEYRNVAGLLSRADHRIYVGGRDRTKLVAGLEWQVKAVRSALDRVDVPVHPALCFTSSDWGWFAKPFRHEGVLVTWASRLAQEIAEPGPLGPDGIEDVANKLSLRLKPAT